MAKYVFRYMFEWGGTCLWSANDAAIDKFGYGVDEQELPLSRKLKDLLRYLQAYHDTMMDMDNAPEDSPWWTEDDSIMFNKKKKFAYEQLCKELGKILKYSIAVTSCRNNQFQCAKHPISSRICKNECGFSFMVLNF